VPTDKTERLLNKIGELLAEDIDYPIEGTLLYARLARYMVGPSIFKDRGNHILYRDPDLDRLGDALLDLWEAEAPNHRWAEVEYVVRGGKFEVAFTYPEEIDPDEEPMDRRKRIVARHFGDKPIVYPPPPHDDDGQLFEL
jgi:hypothetical protein